ncbi:DNA polymerase III subunit epsilon [Candidatus Palibaumannia cicadellinicola]|uniref:DNA polymerase III subunit epsilon n=1 Tax=Candidatus Palibaumannia cicadellinicola TaxID=186490 RepID=UPI00056FECA1|nr:DNA polymerase III subunit epsilon [Candidatus Baumannia cicadellinicola]
MNTNIKRQIILDTETTGINKLGVHYEGHRIIEIGAVEIINRRITSKYFHVYLNPERPIDQEAFNIHGISNEFLKDKPTFAQIVKKFIAFISGSELIIHNAKFDIGFIDYEFRMLNCGINNTNTFCKVTDSLLLARKIFPGKHNSLDALCNRYCINRSTRTKHGALLDAKILAKVFLLMTGGQITIDLTIEPKNKKPKVIQDQNIYNNLQKTAVLKVIYATYDEVTTHNKLLDLIETKSRQCLWRT